MSFSTASYLLRFDDVCPTMSKRRFERFMLILERHRDRHRIRPILAVIPDNQDEELKVDAPDADFWNRMRALEAAGATIALHGYRHVCNSSGRSLLGLHANTEFAGVAEETQREWIRAGLEILRGNGLSPRLFIAPRHGFDRATLRVLREEGVPFLSDGFARRPFTRGGVTWIPQQLWGPVERTNGLWTICLHTNTADFGVEERLDHFLHTHADEFIGFDEAISRGGSTKLGLNERLVEVLATQRVRLRSL